MKIAVDLNDVLRKYTQTFGELYKKAIDPDIDLEEVEVKSYKMDEVFHFEDRSEYETFVYEDYPWELFGKANPCDNGLGAMFTNWVTKTLTNVDTEEPIDVILVSTFEYGLTIPSTYWFISKLGARTREVYLPKDSSTIWDKCDVLFTANPHLLEIKPEGKVSVKIKTDYNKDVAADFEYASMSTFLNNAENNTNDVLEKTGKL